MIKGIGIDIVETKRIKDVIARHGEVFMNRVFTPKEREIGHRHYDSPHFFAGRWAAKEAASKALCCGIGAECSFTEMEIIDTEIGVPVLTLSGSAARTAANLGVENMHVSISHEKDYAVAVVIMESLSDKIQ